MKSSVLKRIPFEIPDNVQGCDVVQNPMANQLEKLGPTAIKVKRSRSASAIFMKIPIELQQGYVKISYRYEDEEDIINACYCHLLYRDIAFGRLAVDNARDYSMYTYKTPEKQGAELVFDLFVKRPGTYFLSLQRAGNSASGSVVNVQTIFYDIKITQLVKVKTSIAKKPNEEALPIPIKKGSSVDRVGVSISYDNNGVWRLSGKATSSNYFSVFNLHNANQNKAFPGELKHRKIKLIVEGADAPTVSLFGIGPKGQYGWQSFTEKDLDLTKLYFRIHVTEDVTYNSVFTIKVVYDEQISDVRPDIVKQPENLFQDWIQDWIQNGVIKPNAGAVEYLEGKKCLHIYNTTKIPTKMIPPTVQKIKFKYLGTLGTASWASMNCFDGSELKKIYLDCHKGEWKTWEWDSDSGNKPITFDLYCEGARNPTYIDLEESGIWINDKKLGKTNG